MGGLARLERAPEKSRHEIVVALANPAVNVVVALMLVEGVRLDLGHLQELDQPGAGRLAQVALLNLILLLFNLSPAVMHAQEAG